jgi:hypothetical protein
VLGAVASGVAEIVVGASGAGDKAAGVDGGGGGDGKGLEGVGAREQDELGP